MSDSSPGPIDHARLKGLVRPAKWAAGVLLAVAVIGFGVVPPVARHYAVKILNESTGRTVSIEGVSFNPFTLAVEVRGAKVMEPDGVTPGLAFEQLGANLELESVVRGGPVLHALSLAGLRLKLVRMAEGRHNWSDVIERLAARPATEGESRFSIGNIQLVDGQVSIDDQVEGLQHELTEINVGVPFLSNLPVKVDVFVEPSLSAVLNDQPLVLAGRSKPFSNDRETVLELSLKDFQLAPWLPYLPFEPAFKLSSGSLATDLAVAFSQPSDLSPTIALKGQVRIDKLVVRDKADNQVVSVGEFELELADVQPLVNRFHFSKLRLAKPELDLVRLADGGINLQQLLPLQEPVKQSASSKSKQRRATAATPAAETEVLPASRGEAKKLDFLLASARLRDGVVRFEDRTLAGPFRARVESINFDLRDLSSTGDMPAEIRLDYVTDGGEKFSHQESLRLEPFELDGNVTIEQLKPARYAPYFALALPGADVRGGTIDGTVRYTLALNEGELQGAINAETLALSDFVLGLDGNKTHAVKVPQLLASNAQVDLTERKISVAGLEVKGASVSVIRQRDGRIDLMALAGPSAPAGKGASKRGAGDAPWSVNVVKLVLEGASVRLEDRSAGKPVVLVAEGIALKVDNFSTDKGAALALELESRINKGGKLGAIGTVVLDPLKTSLKLDLRSVDLLPLQPYVLEQTRIAISRGNVSTKGTLVLEAARDGSVKTQFTGDLSVANFASVDRQSATDFVRWRNLNVRGVVLKLAPFALDVRDIALNDFYTRLILSEEGKLNLREIQPGTEAADVELQKAEAALADAQGPIQPMPRIRIGRIDVKGGNIAFSDRFVRPNYDANLTGMAGSLIGLASDPGTIAKLSLLGKVDNSAPVSVEGELNLFRQDQYLNIGASVKDFELTSLSSYSGKYVGYGIQKGKLSAELVYRIEDRKLSATNRIFLDQLTFGEAVDSPDAVNLPVQLAVSLLKNGRGEIDLNLPVSGTMDDPEFSVFGLVMRALFNLVGKAVTAPFSLLGAAFGGGEELSKLEFDPGVSRPGAPQVEKLTVLATALIDRPALRLDVTGLADPATDLEGIRKAKLLDQVRAVKLKALIKRGESAPSLEEIELSAQEYPDLLAQVYDDAEIKKPRNLIGFAKRLPVPETEALLLADVKVGDEDIKALALQRAQRAREWLVDEGKVSPERVFLVAPTAAQVSAGGRLVHFSLR